MQLTRHLLAGFMVILFMQTDGTITVATSADVCLTKEQARARWPKNHLWWRTTNRCWTNEKSRNDNGLVQRSTVRHRNPPTPPVPVPRQSVLWPTLASTVATALDAALLTPESSIAWPLLLDVDEITTDKPTAECCWPPLDDVPPFTERWFALPSNWFASMRGMK